MMFGGFRRAVSLVNGRVLTESGVASSLRFRRRVLSLDEPPAPRDTVIDLHGAWVLPGLINAHDHLELNHYGPWTGRGTYANASEWIREVGPILERDPEASRRRGWPLHTRLFIGALKNLLAGVTTVSQHNPFYPELRGRFPIRVVRRYGWAHSLELEHGRAGANGEPAGAVKARHAATPPDRPFILHAAEGIDRAAHDELARLDALGCLTSNTVLVHGVALTDEGFAHLVSRRARLVWCPTSNVALFGQTAPVGRWCAGRTWLSQTICLGTDSRLTGSRDLLEECKVAARHEPGLREHLLAMVTSAPGRALRLKDAGRIALGAPADLVVVATPAATAADALLDTSRRHVSLVVIDGRPRVGSPSFAPAFEARRIATAPLSVDGESKLVARSVACSILSLPEPEPGVECVPCG